jgi:hypothetical protein
MSSMSILKVSIKVASKFILTNPQHAVEEVKTIELLRSNLSTQTHSILLAKTIESALIPMFHIILRPYIPCEKISLFNPNAAREAA